MQAHQAMALEKRNGRAKAYAEEGKKLGTWSMWVALETYMQVRKNYFILHPFIRNRGL